MRGDMNLGCMMRSIAGSWLRCSRETDINVISAKEDHVRAGVVEERRLSLKRSVERDGVSRLPLIRFAATSNATFSATTFSTFYQTQHSSIYVVPKFSPNDQTNADICRSCKVRKRFLT